VPSEILLLPPHLVKIELSGTKLIKAYVLGSGTAGEKQIPTDDVIHFRFPDPSGSVYGFAPAKAAWGSILDYRAAQAYERALNNNSGTPSLFIKYSGVVEKAELARIAADWNRQLKGINKSGRVFVGDSKFDVQPVGLSPREMSFREGRRVYRNEIAACFGIPEDILSTENSNRSTAETANRVYEQFTVKPRLTRISDKLNERLAPLYDERIFFAYDENVPEDSAGKLAEVVGLHKEGILLTNEARAMYDLPPLKQEEQKPEEPPE